MLKAFTLLIAISAVTILSSCDSSLNSSAPASRNYQGAGSRWVISLTDAVFSMTKYESISDTTADLTLSGTVSRNSSNQFLTLTVLQSSNTSEVALNTTVTALEIPNTGVIIKTPDNPTPLVAVISGSCPTAAINGNWIITKPRLDSGEFQPNSLDDDGAGTVSYNPATNSFQTLNAGIVNRQFETDTGSMNYSAPITLTDTCSNGLLAANIDMGNPQPDIFDMYFTASGFEIVKFPAAAGDQIIFGLPRQSSAVTGSSIAGTYSALVYEGLDSGTPADLSSSTLTPAQVTVDSSGNAQIRKYTDVAGNTLAGSDAFTISAFSTTFTFTDNNNAVNTNGLYHGEFATNQRVTCGTALVNSTRVMACNGFTGSGAGRRPVTILGHSR